MLWMLFIGGCIAISTVIMSYIELLPFFRALKQLNDYTTNNPSISNRLAYPVRFLSILRLAWPTVIDIVLACACGFLGLNGGVLGCLIGLTISFAASCALKVHRHFISPRLKSNSTNWRIA